MSVALNRSKVKAIQRRAFICIYMIYVHTIPVALCTAVPVFFPLLPKGGREVTAVLCNAVNAGLDDIMSAMRAKASSTRLAWNSFHWALKQASERNTTTPHPLTDNWLWFTLAGDQDGQA